MKPDAPVDDGDPRLIADLPQLDDDLAARLGVFARVVQQVLQDLLDPGRIGH